MLIVDRFGNVQLNLTASDLDQMGIVPGTRIELEIGLERYYAVAARTFADVARGDIVLYEDSYRNISIAINVGDAASVISARRGRPGSHSRARVNRSCRRAPNVVWLPSVGGTVAPVETPALREGSCLLGGLYR